MLATQQMDNRRDPRSAIAACAATQAAPIREIADINLKNSIELVSKLRAIYGALRAEPVESEQVSEGHDLTSVVISTQMMLDAANRTAMTIAQILGI